MNLQRSLGSALFAALAALSTALFSQRAEACAGCRNPSLATARGGEGSLAPGAIRVGLSATGTAIHVVHEAGCRDESDCHEVPVQPAYLHDQRIYPLELRLSAEYGIDKTFGVELQVPFRFVKTTIEFSTLGGAPYTPEDPDVHHRNETVSGFSDPWLLLRAGGVFQEWWLAARPGVSIPLGRTVEDPFELGDRGIRHQHIQLGTGTFDPVLVLEASRSFDPVRLQFFAQGQYPLYENGHDYRAPWRIHGGTAVGTTLIGKLSGSLGVEALHEDAEHWKGELRQDGNLGRTEILAAAMFSQAIGKTELSLSVRVPVFRDIVEGDEPPGTLSQPLTLSLGVSQVFGGGDEGSK